MVLSKIILVALLEFVAITTVLGWSHVSRNQFQSMVKENEVALVACKSPRQIPVSTKISWLMQIASFTITF
jgi:hypothetical protein